MGVTCASVSVSQSFSTPRCRYPTYGVAFTTTSPSSHSFTRKTPCVEGCCGPKFITMRSPSGSSVSRRKRGACGGALLTLPPRRPRRIDGAILAERMPRIVLGHHDAAEIGMAGEAHSDEIELLALLPVRRREEIAERRDVHADGHAHAPDREARAGSERARAASDLVMPRVRLGRRLSFDDLARPVARGDAREQAVARVLQRARELVM